MNSLTNGSRMNARKCRLTPQQHSATAKLENLCQRLSPNVVEVQQCVGSGADVCFFNSKLPRPILHFFIYRELKECVMACLESSALIDFTVVDHQGWTPLHYICAVTHEEDFLSLLRGVVGRLERHSGDLIDWKQCDVLGTNCFSCAAFQNRLSLCWSVVWTAVNFADKSVAIPITKGAFPHDWESLGADQTHFTLLAGFVDPNTALKEFSRSSAPSSRAVADAVRAGGDVTFKDYELRMPVLSGFICREELHYDKIFVKKYADPNYRCELFDGEVELVQLCLSTPQPINFAVRDVHGQTPLHRVVHVRDAGKAAAMLRLFTHRLLTHPSDIANWDMKDKQGMDVLSAAAHKGRLALYWNAVKVLPCFRDKRIVHISAQISEADWELLETDDRPRFLAQLPFLQELW